MTAQRSEAHARHVFHVGRVVYDQSTLELHVGGDRRPIEAKPRVLLEALLVQAGTLVTKRALIEAVWGNAERITDTSLTTAMSKLRAALGADGRGIIAVVHGAGYRIDGPVVVSPAGDGMQPGPPFAVDDAVPHRPQWRLRKLLGSPLLNDVWLAGHAETQDLRVFKFARTARRLETLKRQEAAARVLRAALGEGKDFAPVLDSNFEVAPFCIACAWSGEDLPSWTAAHGGLAAFPMDRRVALLGEVAAIVAAAHGAGVLHGALKPANILIREDGDGHAHPCVADFGAGGLTDLVRLESLGISLDDVDDPSRNRAGTLAYIAPEMLAGQPPAPGGDIYALGVLLYQMAVGDFARPLGLGWESEIADELLRQDIADAASADPARRMASAASLVERLQSLPARRATLLRARQDQARMADLQRQVERARLRRPWMAGAAALMLGAMAAITWFELHAVRDRDQARQNAALMRAVNAFLTEDLLGRGDPASSGKPDETLMQAAQASEHAIEARFSAEPMEAGAIYMSLAQAYESRSAYDDARRAYTRAIAWFDRQGAAGAAQAAIAACKQAGMEAISGQAGSLTRAGVLTGRAGPRIAALGSQRAEAELWLFRAQGLIDNVRGDPDAARRHFLRAIGMAEAMPYLIDESSRLALMVDLSVSLMHQANWRAASDLLSDLLGRELALHGPAHAETLRVGMRLTEVRAAEGDLDGALGDIDRLSPMVLRVFGPDHRVTLTLLATRADVLTRLGRFDEAQATEKTLYRDVVRLDGERSWTALGTLANTAQTLCRAHRVPAGLAAGEAAYKGAREAFGEAHSLTQAAAGDLAFCLVIDHQYSRALNMLGRIDVKTVGEATLDQDYAAEIDVMRADIAFSTGDPAMGSALAHKSAALFAHPGADPYMQGWAYRLAKIQ